MVGRLAAVSRLLYLLTPYAIVTTLITGVFFSGVH